MKTLLAVLTALMLIVTNQMSLGATLVTFSGPGYVSQGDYSYVPTTISFSGNKRSVTLSNSTVMTLISVTSWTIGSIHTGIEYDETDGAYINFFGGRNSIAAAYYFTVNDFGTDTEGYVTKFWVAGYLTDPEGLKTDFDVKFGNVSVPEPTIIALITPLGLLTLLHRRRS